jgi:hypothetical protein
MNLAYSSFLPDPIQNASFDGAHSSRRNDTKKTPSHSQLHAEVYEKSGLEGANQQKVERKN